MTRILPLAISLLLSAASVAQDAAAWQKRAIAKYPELAKEGSPIHTKFLSFVTELKETEPTFFKTASWPVILADRAASAVKADAAAAAEQAARDAMWKNKHTLREVKTDERSFLGKPFSLNGKIEVASLYVFGYGNAEGTHLNVHLNDGTESADVYMDRTKAAGLRKQLVDSGSALKGSFLVIILPERYTGKHFQLELLDYKPSIE